MNAAYPALLWQQFGAALRMLENTLVACPEHLWEDIVYEDPEDPRYGQYWFIAYHALFWTDLYTSGIPEGFKPPAPFIRGALPEQPYTKAQVLDYFARCWDQAQSVIEEMDDETTSRICTFPWGGDIAFAELLMYTMRHIQEHASQFSLHLGRAGIPAPDWVSKASEENA